MGTLQEKITKFYLSFLIMETYYTKREYNEMESALNKKCKALETKVKKLTEKLKELKKDYAILLETANEKVED